MSRIYIADQPTMLELRALTAGQGDPVYGYVEHMAETDASKRIDYIGANKDFTPLTVTMGGGYDLGDWADFPWLKGNIPYMVRSDGFPDYKLDPSDYTLREDGTASDVANTDYDGGAFAWCPKIFKREYISGTDRIVEFCMTERPGFEPWGFSGDPDGTVETAEGMWLPMFFGIHSVYERMTSLAYGTMPSLACPYDQALADVARLNADRAYLFGGPLFNTLIDLQILFAKTTDLWGAYGTGQFYNRLEATDPVNPVLAGGQFFGTDDNNHFNKVFHSIVLGSNLLPMWDETVHVEDGEICATTFYNHGTRYPTGIRWTDLGVVQQYYRVAPGWGSYPVDPGYIADDPDPYYVPKTDEAGGAVFYPADSEAERNFTRGGYVLYKATNRLMIPYNKNNDHPAAVLLMPPKGVCG